MQTKKHYRALALVGVSLLLSCISAPLGAQPPASSQPQAVVEQTNYPLAHRPIPGKSTTSVAPSTRLIYVDPNSGNDAADGTLQRPIRSLAEGAKRLVPGDTLLLMSGIYREQLRLAVHGTMEKPITVRSAPGHHAVIDTSIPDFFDSPETAWAPSETNPTEFISTKTYPNIRDIVGCFGDTFQGLQTYWHRLDLLATSELWVQPKDQDVLPVYVGPGIWYNRETNRIHARLAHTNLEGIENYKGQTDPRKLALIIAPFRALPLHLDGARHVIIQDLFFRGAGYETVLIDNSRDITLLGLTIRAGTFGVRVSNTQRLKFLGSRLYGNAAPWCLRQENSLRDRPGKNLRDVARLTSHALWVPDTGREFSVYAFPPNDEFEIGYNLFADSHDGVYLGGVTTDFHHNIIENCHDDGVYLSPMYPYGSGTIIVRQNLFQRCLIPFAFGGSDPTRDTIYIYRNIVDQRLPIGLTRPAAQNNKPGTSRGYLFSDHGSPTWPKMFIYQNTFILGDTHRHAHGGAYLAVTPEQPRVVLNNIFHHADKLPGYTGITELTGGRVDGNIFSSATADPKALATLFTRFRASEAFKKVAAQSPPGPDQNSLAADAKLSLPEPASVSKGKWSSGQQYKPATGSPALGAGVLLPETLPDVTPADKRGQAKPDIGAIGGPMPILQVGPDAFVEQSDSAVTDKASDKSAPEVKP